MADLVGKTLVKQYQVIEFIGRGGMAEVYKVWDPDRMIYLAAKVLLKSLAMDRVFLQRFKREAASLAKLQHPNIVRYYGLFHHDDIAFMLLDFIEGVSLQEWIFKQGLQKSPDMVIQVTRSMCSALHYAHMKGLVHCDIKPGNIMIDPNNNILLMDFGIARMTDAATATMVGFGTPAYMAPELVLGRDPTPQSDVYSLGVVLYEMVTGGERPFTGERAQTTGTISEKVRWEQVFLPPPPPRQFNPGISGQIEAVILRCLAKDAGIRFSSGLELMNAIELASNGRLNTQNWPQHPVRAAVSHQNIPINPGNRINTMPGVGVEQQALPPKRQNTKTRNGILGLMGLGVGIVLLVMFFLVIVLFLIRKPPSPSLLEVGQSSRLSSTSSTLDADEVFTPTPERIPTLTVTPIPAEETAPTSTRTPTSHISDPTSTKADPKPTSTLVYITPTPRIYYPLDNCAPSQLRFGDSAFVSYEGGPNALRDTPDTNSPDNIMLYIKEGEVLLIIGGPVCNYEWVLWEVETTRGEQGWTPEGNGEEFWLLPLTTRQLCEGALPSRLVVGKRAKVKEEPPTANRLRVGPSTSDDVIDKIQPGKWMLVLEGPHCGQNANWWKVESETTGIIGWTMEGRYKSYFLAPEP